MMGDHRYHSIFGMDNGCFAVHPSDTAPALIALNATIVTTKRQIKAEEFWEVKCPESTVLVPGEIVTAIYVPAPPAGAKSAFLKFAIREVDRFSDRELRGAGGWRSAADCAERGGAQAVSGDQGGSGDCRQGDQ